MGVAVLSVMISPVPGPGVILAIIALGLGTSSLRDIAAAGGRVRGAGIAEAANAVAVISLAITFLMWGGCVICVL